MYVCMYVFDSGWTRAQVYYTRAVPDQPIGAGLRALNARALVLPSSLAQRLYQRGRTNPGGMRPKLSDTRLRTCCQLFALL